MSSGRTRISIKEAVRIAQSNNFLGLMCSSRLLVSGLVADERGYADFRTRTSCLH